MPVREDILTPIPGENPSGSNLRHAPIYDQIKEARRNEDATPQGDWEHEIKAADYKEVVKLSQEALATQSKDLQLAVWLAEALIYLEQGSGLCAGLTLLRDLTTAFWDSLYPELEDGDAEFRATPLEWFGNYFDPSKGSSPSVAIRRIPITRSGLDWFQYRVSRSIPSDAEAQGSEAKAETRKAAVAEGKLTPEEFDSAFRDTPKTFYRQLESDFKTAGENLEALNSVCQEKFGSVAPGFRELRRALEDVSTSVRILLTEKLKLDPDPVAPSETSSEGVEGADGTEAAASDGVLEEGAELSGNLELRTRQDALRLLIASARFLRRSDPSDSVPYLMVRALRWGELRGANGDIAGSLLEAPSAEIRVKLKNSALAQEWGKVLEIAESAAASGCGRGWLDLHRYTIRACDEMGYTAVARTLRSSLKALLADLPQLPTLTLADDTGTANPETMDWLVRESLYTPGAGGDNSG
jgi:type VI secretion system protein ImpA